MMFASQMTLNYPLNFGVTGFICHAALKDGW